MARFATVDECDISQLLLEKNSVNTHKATNVAWSVLNSYLSEKSLCFSVSTVLTADLDEILRKFYAEIRKKDGSLYTKSSFRSIRAGIQRKIKEERPTMDIILDKEFFMSNEVFRAQCVKLKKDGLGKIIHKQPINHEDMKRLYESDIFAMDSPRSLQRKVFFDLMLFMCRRGQENLRNLKKSSFKIKKDSDGRHCIEKAIDELTKNHRGENDAQESGIIYETGSPRCPVKSFRLYLTHLNPKIDELFQRPKSGIPVVPGGPWYDAQVLGVNTLANMMKNISLDAKLSQVYTNHCIRATSVTILDDCGIEARHIMTVSGHRSESSIRSYARTGLSMKRKMSDELAKYCQQVPTFDFGVDLGVDDEPLEKRPLSVDTVSSSAVCSQQSNNNALSSFIGHSARYVEFTNCTINFCQQ